MLKRTLFSSAMAAIALVGGAAIAAEATGRVEMVDGAHKTVTLEGGQVFQLPPNYNDPTLSEPGAVAQITYEVQDGKNVATDIIVQKK